MVSMEYKQRPSAFMLKGTHDDFQKIVGLPRGPVFPGHLCSASKDRYTAGLKTRMYLQIKNEKQGH